MMNTHILTNVSTYRFLLWVKNKIFLLIRNYTHIKLTQWQWHYNIHLHIYKLITENSCPVGWVYYQGECYLHVESRAGITWYMAESACHSLGGHLVSIKDSSRLQFLHFMLTTLWTSSYKDVFIGNTCLLKLIII